MAEEGSFKLRMLAVSPYSRTMVTGQWACRTTASETLPNKALLSLPWPLLPITINPAPISSANSTISSSALPSRRWVSLTVPRLLYPLGLLLKHLLGLTSVFP